MKQNAITPPRARWVAGAVFQVTCALALSAPLAAQSPPVTDTQFWTELDLATGLSPRVEFTVPLMLRASTSLPNPVLGAPGALLSFQLHEHLSLDAGYLFADLPHAAGGLQVHLPLLAITGKTKLGRLALSDRNRVEILEGFPEGPIRYRNRLVLDLPFTTQHRAWHAFLADEAFYDFSVEHWTQNRFQAGARTRLTERLSLDAYYLLRNARRALPGQVNVVGTTLSVRLR